jgi:hypothetical protein
MRAHLQFLEQRMAAIQHIPTLFEYYSAIQLTKQFQTRFYAYQDIPDSHKKYAGFPIYDKGIDLIDETFQNIAQVKYYKKHGTIYYGNLSTFLASPILVGRKHLQLTLVRTQHSWLHPEIQNIVDRGDMKDVTLCPKQFLQAIKR